MVYKIIYFTFFFLNNQDWSQNLVCKHTQCMQMQLHLGKTWATFWFYCKDVQLGYDISFNEEISQTSNA